jgi:sterol-4alpha-carboxylate 3-dehydrogenase (decarboxylating)
VRNYAAAVVNDISRMTATVIESVFLVGGSGFLGLHMINEFWNCSPRPNIHVFDIKPLPEVLSSEFDFDPAKIQVHIGDITNAEDVEKALKASKPQVIVHSASPIHGQPRKLYFKVNVDGTRTLLAAAKDLKIPAFVYTSSAGVLFDGQDLRNVPEDYPFPQNEIDAYNLTKQMAERMVLRANSPQLRTISLRPAGIIGTGAAQAVVELRRMALRNQHRIQLGYNDCLTDFTLAQNVCFGHVLAAQQLLDADKAESISGEAYHLTNDEPLYFWSFAKLLWKHEGYVCDNPWVIPPSLGVALGYVAEFFTTILKKPPGLTPFRVRTTCASRYYDVSKAKEKLGYYPRISLEEGIAQICKGIDEEKSKGISLKPLGH